MKAQRQKRRNGNGFKVCCKLTFLNCKNGVVVIIFVFHIFRLGQLQGDLDDNKLVDRVTGERRVFRKRGTPDKRHGLHQSKPKRFVFAVDVSASMARMNAWDGRLDRMVIPQLSSQLSTLPLMPSL